MTEPDNSNKVQETDRNLTRDLVLTAPLYLLVPVLFALLASTWNIELSLPWIILGAVGWLVALFLRAPVAMITQRLTTVSDTVQQVVILSSGPAEELIRLALVLITTANLDIAYAIGLGWGGIEVIYALINGFVIASLLQRTDEEALKARQTMEDMGLLRAGTRPVYGVVERVAVTAVHIGFTLLLAFQPLLVLVTMPVHSFINYGFIVMMRRRVNISLILLILIGIGLAAYFLGLAALLSS
jgi:hypothetical protein